MKKRREGWQFRAKKVDENFKTLAKYVVMIVDWGHTFAKMGFSSVMYFTKHFDQHISKRSIRKQQRPSTHLKDPKGPKPLTGLFLISYSKSLIKNHGLCFQLKLYFTRFFSEFLILLKFDSMKLLSN